MRNKFPGWCYYCQKWVDKGDGHFERRGNHWETIHAECVFEQREEKERIQEQREKS